MRSRLACAVSLAAAGALALSVAGTTALAQDSRAWPEPGGDPHHDGWHRFLPQHARLGVQLQDMTPELREFLRAPKDRGILVVRVNEDSPAERAGLRVGDVIVAANGEPVSETFALVHRVFTAEKDARLALEIVRDGKSRKLEVPLAGEPSVAAGPMRWMDERMPELRENLEQRMKELEQRMKELEERLREDLPAKDAPLDT